MRMFEVDELEDHISEVLDQVRETGETVAVTKGGEVIAHLVPANMPQWLGDLSASLPQWLTEPPSDDLWANLDRIRDKISAHWPKDVSAVDAVRDVRREL